METITEVLINFFLQFFLSAVFLLATHFIIKIIKQGKEQEKELEVIITFYESGDMKEEYEVIKGTDTKDGYYFKYSKNGNIHLKCNYVNGKLEGEVIIYFENGKVSIKYNYVNGKKHGEYISYYYNGNVSEKSNYVNGKLHGELIIFYENGEWFKKEIWRNGKLISSKQF